MAQTIRSKVQVWILCSASLLHKVLLFKVIDERGGGWHPVTGHVEDGESLSHAALREVTEETGFSFKSNLNELGLDFKFTSRFGPAHEHVFYIEVENALKPMLDPKEHCDYQWCSVEEAHKKINFEFQKKALTQILKTVLAIAR